MFVGPTMFFKLSPSALMFLRIRSISMYDVYLSFDRRADPAPVNRMGSARAYASDADVRSGNPSAEFNIYAYASAPQSVETTADAFSDFIQGIDFDG